MTLKARIVQNTSMVARVNTTGDSLSSAKPVTLKNQVKEIRSIEDFGNVEGVDIVTGATLVYNSENDKYEIRPFEIADLGGLDGGTF
jgi:hypothetical protein